MPKPTKLLEKLAQDEKKETSLPLSKVAERWGMTTQQLFLLCKAKKLRAFRIAGGRWRMKLEDVEAAEEYNS